MTIRSALIKQTSRGGSVLLRLLMLIALADLTPNPRPRLLNGDDVAELANDRADTSTDQGTGIATLLVKVSPAGRGVACQVTEASGSASFDRRACNVLLRRARYSPATDAQGAPVEAEEPFVLSWASDGLIANVDFDLALQVVQLPADYHAPVKARLTFNENGRLDTCNVTTSSGSASVDHAACQFVTQLTIKPFKTGVAGVKAAALRFVTVTFAVGGNAVPTAAQPAAAHPSSTR